MRFHPASRQGRRSARPSARRLAAGLERQPARRQQGAILAVRAQLRRDGEADPGFGHQIRMTRGVFALIRFLMPTLCFTGFFWFRRAIFDDGLKSSTVPDYYKCLRDTFAAKRDQLLRAPELKKAARIARYLYRYVGRVCGELEACNRVSLASMDANAMSENPCPSPARAPERGRLPMKPPERRR